MMWIDGEYFPSPVTTARAQRQVQLLAIHVKVIAASIKDFPYNIIEGMMLMTDAALLSCQPLFPPKPGGITPTNKTGDLIIPNVNI